jgi:hypothetical protein
MTDTQSQTAPTSGFLRFWTSLPGVLTAAAAVITAIGGIYIASGSASGSGPTPGPPPTGSTSAPGTQGPTREVSTGTPIVIQDPTTPAGPTPGDVTALFIACDQGDLNACASLADIAELECNQGIFDSCLILDQLTALGLS